MTNKSRKCLKKKVICITGDFVKCVSHAANARKKGKKKESWDLTGAQKGLIVSCAAQSGYGKPISIAP